MQLPPNPLKVEEKEIDPVIVLDGQEVKKLHEPLLLYPRTVAVQLVASPDSTVPGLQERLVVV